MCGLWRLAGEVRGGAGGLRGGAGEVRGGVRGVVAVVYEHRVALLGTVVVGAPLLYAAVSAYCWLRHTRNKWRTLTENLPGLQPHWLYGNLHQVPTTDEAGLKVGQELTELHKTAYVTWVGPLMPVVSVVHPDSIKCVMKQTERKPTHFGGSYRLIMPWIGDGLLVSSGDKWFRNRRLLTPAFHFDVLKPYIHVYNEAVATFLEKLKKTNGEYVEVFSLVGLLTLDVIMQCAFSFKDNIQQRGDSHPYVSAVKRLGAILLYRAFHPYLYPDVLFYATPQGREFAGHAAYAHRTAAHIIRKRRQQLAAGDAGSGVAGSGVAGSGVAGSGVSGSGVSGSGVAGSGVAGSGVAGKRYKDFLDILLLARDDDGAPLTEQEIRDEVDTFMFEGHDTTASAISWILYTLACHPEAQDKARQEVDAMMAGRPNSCMTWEDIKSLGYLTQCIKEAMRLHSPVPMIGRVTHQDAEVCGKRIPAGVSIDIVIHNLHHNPHVWGHDHQEFRPERFSPENLKDMDPYAFIPFSAGPRNCIGQHFAMHELKVTVARVLREYRVERDPDRPARHYAMLVMRTMDGMYLKFTPRTDN